MKPDEFTGKILFPIAVALTAIAAGLAIKVIGDLDEIKRRLQDGLRL